MHELSIAMSIIDGVTEAQKTQGFGRVRKVFLKLGPLSGVDKEALLFCYGSATEGTGLEGSELEFEEVPLSGECKHCGKVQPAQSAQRLFCAECDNPMPELVTGKELEIASLEIDD